MALQLPDIPCPRAIQREIRELQARIGTVRALLRVAEVSEVVDSLQRDRGLEGSKGAKGKAND